MVAEKLSGLGAGIAEAKQGMGIIQLQTRTPEQIFREMKILLQALKGKLGILPGPQAFYSNMVVG